MILRRLADGIKNQDWFVVVVEIMIVVVGIFIGLQVDDWNEARLDRLEEQKVLARLHNELETSVDPEGMTRQYAIQFSRTLRDLRPVIGGQVEPPPRPNSLFNRILGYRTWELLSFNRLSS